MHDKRSPSDSYTKKLNAPSAEAEKNRKLLYTAEKIQ